MKITITDWDARPHCFNAQAVALTRHVDEADSDLVLLPEMPFRPWLAANKQPDVTDWEHSVAMHERRISDLGWRVRRALAGSRPVIDENGQHHNRAFLWQGGEIIAEPHEKSALPEEEGFWETRWYQPGTQQKAPFPWRGLRVGFAICTEIWDASHTRRLADAGVDLILAPRATPDLGDDVWLSGLRTLAVQSGAYVLSSNFAYALADNLAFEGMSVAVDPDGMVMGVTDGQTPFLTVGIDAEFARSAKSTYPRYIFAKG